MVDSEEKEDLSLPLVALVCRSTGHCFLSPSACLYCYIIFYFTVNSASQIFESFHCKEAFSIKHFMAVNTHFCLLKRLLILVPDFQWLTKRKRKIHGCNWLYRNVAQQLSGSIFISTFKLLNYLLFYYKLSQT